MSGSKVVGIKGPGGCVVAPEGEEKAGCRDHATAGPLISGGDEREGEAGRRRTLLSEGRCAARHHFSSVAALLYLRSSIPRWRDPDTSGAPRTFVGSHNRWDA